MSDLQTGDVAALDYGLARVVRVDGDKALLRHYGGNKAPIGFTDISRLRRVSPLTFMLDEHDLARLREVRRLTFEANEHYPTHGWGCTAKSLSAHLRAVIRLHVDMWADGERDWAEVIEEGLHDARQVAPTGTRAPFRCHVTTKTRNLLFKMSDSLRRSIDDIARASIVQSLEVLVSDGPPDETMIPALRRCAYPPRAAAMYAGSSHANDDEEDGSAAVPLVEAPAVVVPAPEPPKVETRVSVDVLAEAIREQARAASSPPTWTEDGDEIRCAASVAPAAKPPPEKPKIRPEDVLAIRPLKPPGHAAQPSATVPRC